MSQVVFTNPANGNTYTWPVNTTTENAVNKTRQIERTSTTGNVGVVKQQGDDLSYILDWTINVHGPSGNAMEIALWEWYMLSRTQTIYLTDWMGEEYEGQIILVTRTRQPAQLNGQPWAIYQVQFEVYAFLSGVLATAGVTP